MNAKTANFTTSGPTSISFPLTGAPFWTGPFEGNGVHFVTLNERDYEIRPSGNSEDHHVLAIYVGDDGRPFKEWCTSLADAKRAVDQDAGVEHVETPSDDALCSLLVFAIQNAKTDRLMNRHRASYALSQTHAHSKA